MKLSQEQLKALETAISSCDATCDGDYYSDTVKQQAKDLKESLGGLLASIEIDEMDIEEDAEGADDDDWRIEELESLKAERDELLNKQVNEGELNYEDNRTLDGIIDEIEELSEELGLSQE